MCMKKKIIFVLFFMCTILSGCRHNSEEIDYMIDTENNIFEVTENNQAQVYVMGSYNLRFRDIDTTQAFVVEQPEIAIPITMESMGYPTKLGLLLIMDGKPISYYTDEEDEKTFMKYFELGENEILDISIYGELEEGMEGVQIPLYVVGILEPEYQPEVEDDVSYGNYHKQLSLLPLTVSIECDIQEREIVYEEITTQVIDQNSYDKYSMEDGSNILDNAAVWEIESNQTYEHKLVSENGTLSFSLVGFGGDSAEYSVITYVNHQPILVNGKINNTITLEKGQETTFDMEIEIDSDERINTLYVMVVPTAESYMNDQLSLYKTDSYLLINDLIN